MNSQLKTSIEQQLGVEVLLEVTETKTENNQISKTIYVRKNGERYPLMATQSSDNCWTVWRERVNGHSESQWIFLDEIYTDLDFQNLCQHIPPEVNADGSAE